MKLATVLFRRARSVVVLVATVSLLFYYTFQNEIDTLNSYAETESLPQINRPISPVASGTPVVDYGHKPTAPGPRIVNTAKPVDPLGNPLPQTAVDLLSDPAVLVEKNKYFPLLQSGYEDRLVDDACGLMDITAPTIFHEWYPVRYESSLKSVYQQVNLQYPRIQSSHFSDTGKLQESSLLEARDMVRDIFLHSWQVYSLYAFGDDELKPVSKQPVSIGLSWAATMVESLDMLYLLGEKEQISKVLMYLARMDFSRSNETIVDVAQSAERILGSLLSAYELSGKKEHLLLDKATELANFLLRAFDTPNRVPLLHYSWLTKLSNRFPAQNTNIGELGSLSLEFTHLSQLTKNNKYFDAVQRIYKTASASAGEFDIDYLFPASVDASGCVLLTKDKVEQGDHLRDSKVMKSIHNGEYVHCQQSGKFKPISGNAEKYAADQSVLPFYANLAKFLHMLNAHDITESMDITKLLLNGLDRIQRLMIFTPRLPNPEMENLSFVSSLKTQSSFDALSNEKVIQVSRDFSMHHSSCSIGATMALTGKLFNQESFLKTAADVTNGCLHMYDLLGVMPEGVQVEHCSESPCQFNPDLKVALPSPKSEGSPVTDDVAGIKLDQDDTNDALSEKPHKIYVFNNKSPTGDTSGKVDGIIPTLKMPPYLNGVNASYALSSEAIESVFYLYRITGDGVWRDKGIKMLQSTLKKVKKEGARGVWQLSSLNDIFTEDISDRLPSDWFSKTLKYYYLLLSDPEQYSLDDYIFSNGGHLFERKAVLNQLYIKNYKLDMASILEEMEFKKEE